MKRSPVTGIQWTAALVVLALLPAAVMAQSPQERLDAAISHAQEAGIPVSLLQSKISEGRAKGIPMDRIATAVENRLRNLEQAKTAMNRGAGDVDAAQLSVGADAIGAGVSEAVLTQIASSASRDRRAVAVAALTQLVLHGTAPDAALVQVKDALAHGPQALANLAAQSGTDRPSEAGSSQGSNPGAANGSRSGGAPSSVPGPAQPHVPATPPSIRGGGRGGR
jgi:microcompartment protein CcmK/EutM